MRILKNKKNYIILCIVLFLSCLISKINARRKNKWD